MMFDSLLSFIKSNLSEFASFVPAITIILLVLFSLIFVAIFLYLIYILIKKLPWLLKKIILLINLLQIFYLKYRDRLYIRKKLKILPALKSSSSVSSSVSSLVLIKNIFLKSKRRNIPLSICITTSGIGGESNIKFINSLPNVLLDMDSEEHFKLTIDSSNLSLEFISQLCRELSNISSAKPFDDLVLIFDQSKLHQIEYADLFSKIALFHNVMGYTIPISVIVNWDEDVGRNSFFANNINIENKSYIAQEINYIDGRININEITSWLKGLCKSICGTISYRTPEDADIQYVGFLNYFLSLESDLNKLLNALLDSSDVISNNNFGIRLSSIGLHFPLTGNFTIPQSLISELCFLNYEKYGADDNLYQKYKNKRTRTFRYILVAATILFPLNALYNISAIEGFSHELKKKIYDGQIPFMSDKNGDMSLLVNISNIHFVLNTSKSYLTIPKSWSFDLAHNIESYLLVTLRKEIYKDFTPISRKWQMIDAELSGFSISSDQDFDMAVDDLKNDEKLKQILNVVSNTSFHPQFTYEDLWFLLKNTNNKPKYISESEIDWARQVPDDVIKVFSDFPIKNILKSISTKRSAVIDKLIQYKIQNIYHNNKFGVSISNIQKVFDKIQSLKPLISSDFKCIIDFVRLFNESSLSKEDKVLLGDEKSAQLFFSIYTGKLLTTDLLTVDQSISLSSEILQHHRSFQSELRILALPGIGNVFLPPSDESKYVQLTPAFKDFARQWEGLYSQLKSINLSFGTYPVSDANTIVPTFSQSFSPLVISKIDDIVELNSNFKSILDNSLLPFDPLIKNSLNKILTNTFRSHIVNFFNQHLDGLMALSVIDDSVIKTSFNKLNSAQVNQLIHSAQVYNQLVESGVILSLSDKNEIGTRYNSIFDSILDSYRTDLLSSNPFIKLNNYVTSSLKSTYINSLSIPDFGSSLSENFSSGILSIDNNFQQISSVLDLLSNAKAFSVKKSNINFWRGINDILDQYRTSTGPLFDFEAFVASFSDILSQNDCVINKKDSIDASILLRASYRMIREDFAKLCEIAKKNESFRVVDRFISEFQLRYMDKFPFSGKIDSAPITKNEYSLIRARFYEIQSAFDSVSPDLPFESKLFINKLILLFSQLDLSKPQDSFNFNISLNESIGNDILAHLIEVQLIVGNRSYNLRNKNNLISWNPSDQIKLRFRLAINSRYKPGSLNSYLFGVLSISDNTLVYSFSDVWSFYKFIYFFNSSDSISDSNILRVNLPLNSNGTDLTRSISINVTDNKDRLPLPLFRGIKLSNISLASSSKQGTDNVFTTNR